MLTGSYGDKTFSMTALVMMDSSRIDVVLLNPLGATIGRLLYTGEKPVIDSPFIPKTFKAEYIVADLQFCFYDADIVSAALSDIGLAMSAERFEDGTERRIIRDGGMTLIMIERQAGRLSYKNFVRGYSYIAEGDF